MRSTQIHKALAQGMNRFEDSINDVLQYLGTHETAKESLHPAIPQVSVKSLKPAA
jgi:hypothetical protein